MFSSTTTHFFKVVLNETLRDKKIHIPRKFMRKHGETLTSPVILQLPSGLEWKIELEICDGEVWLQKGWAEFAHHHSIEQGHFLVFRYEGNSRFHVIIFDASATEIDYPINPVHFSKSDIDKDKLRQPKDEEIENDVSETGEKSSLQCPRPHKRMKTGVTMPTLWSSPNSKVVGKKKQRNLSSIDKARAVERAVRGFKFSIVMQPSYVCKGHRDLWIPKKFARRYIDKKEGDFTLGISDGRTWSVQYKTRSKSTNGYEITEISSSGGWNAFTRDNNLEVCDVCIFELIGSGNDISHFQVSIVRHHANDDHISPGKLQAKSNATNVIRRKQNVIGSEKDRALKGAISGFKSENPFFSIVMQPWYIHGKGKLCIPNKFVARHIYKREADFNLRVSNGRCWSVRYRATKMSGTVNAYDWKAFARDNKLEVGDVCIFELITSENDILLFQVSFVRHSGQLSADGDQNASNPVKEETCTVPIVNQIAKKEYQNPKKRNRNQVQPTVKSSGGRPPSSEVAFGSKNASFHVWMRAYHFDHASVSIPVSFERSNLGKRTQNVKLMMGKRCWEVKLIMSGGRLFLTKGWSVFARDNGVRIGDVCRFEKVEDDPLVLHVSITRAF